MLSKPGNAQTSLHLFYYIDSNVALLFSTSIYFLLTKQYLDDTSIPNPRYGWVNPVNPG